MRDLRLAVRLLRTTPIVTLVALLSLALGIGANAAIFSIVDALLLRPLPVREPERLVQLVAQSRTPGVMAESWSNPVWERLRDRPGEPFGTAFAFSYPRTFDLAAGGPTVPVTGTFASGEYFRALGVPPLLGRVLGPDDDRRGGGRHGAVAVIGYAFWQRQFGGASDVIGRIQTIERVPFTIVGVLPPGFFGAEIGREVDLVVPLAAEPLIYGAESALDRPTTSWLRIMARLKEEQTIAAAEQQVRALQPGIREATVDRERTPVQRAEYLSAPFSLRAAANGPSMARDQYRRPILLIMTVVALVLLIACANIANLLLARGGARRHELSVRLALGSSRWQLARLLLAESLVLCGTGAAAGLVLAQWASALLVRQLANQFNTIYLDTRVEWRVLAFTAAVVCAATVLAGLAPALRAARVEPIEAIRAHGRGPGGDRRARFAGALVAGQMALSLALVFTAALLVRTFVTLVTRDAGFERAPALVARLNVKDAAAGDEPAARRALYERIKDAAAGVPGVARATIAEVTPISGYVLDVYVQVEGSADGPKQIAYLNPIAPDWFATFGTRLVAGRDFTSRDRPGAPLVAIVNDTFARRFVPGGGAVGRRLRIGAAGRERPWMEIVGVVEDAAYRSLREPVPPTLYVALAQQERLGQMMSLGVRAASGNPAALTRSVAEAIGRVDPRVTITFVPLTRQVELALSRERVLAMLSGSFGLLALLLAGLGLYGLTWHAVGQRRHEIAIRLAIGAEPSGVVRLMLARVALLVAGGLVFGALLCLAGGRLLTPLVYGVTPRDPLTLGASALTLAIIAGLAGWLPARAAARIDPAEVLRSQ